MLKIKLSRTGKKNQPSYRIVVAERRSKRDGQYVALLGNYNPLTSPSTISLDTKAYDAWVSKGAQPTETVRAIRTKADSLPSKISPKTSGIGPKPSKLKARKEKAAKEAAAQTDSQTPEEAPKAEASKPEESTAETAVESAAEEKPAETVEAAA